MAPRRAPKATATKKSKRAKKPSTKAATALAPSTVSKKKAPATTVPVTPEMPRVTLHLRKTPAPETPVRQSIEVVEEDEEDFNADEAFNQMYEEGAELQETQLQSQQQQQQQA